jgi:hypothetical protein
VSRGLLVAFCFLLGGIILQRPVLVRCEHKNTHHVMCFFFVSEEMDYSSRID